MQRGIARRIGSLEEFLLPLSAGVFLARVRTHARRTRKSFGSAVDSLIPKVSDDELERLTTEFESIAFGSDTAVRDAAKREVLAAAGYPDWNPPAEEFRDEGMETTSIGLHAACAADVQRMYTCLIRAAGWCLCFGFQSGIFSAPRRYGTDGD